MGCRRENRPLQILHLTLFFISHAAQVALTAGSLCSSVKMAAASSKSSTDASAAGEPASKGVGAEEGAAVAAAPDLVPSEEGRHVFAHQGM